jgi:hypothetical protein
MRCERVVSNFPGRYVQGIGSDISGMFFGYSPGLRAPERITQV